MENLHLAEIFFTTSGCDGCDKYEDLIYNEVWSKVYRKIYTWLKFFSQPVVVMVVTNMRTSFIMRYEAKFIGIFFRFCCLLFFDWLDGGEKTLLRWWLWINDFIDFKNDFTLSRENCGFHDYACFAYCNNEFACKSDKLYCVSCTMENLACLFVCEFAYVTLLGGQLVCFFFFKCKY